MNVEFALANLEVSRNIVRQQRQNEEWIVIMERQIEIIFGECN